MGNARKLETKMKTREELITGMCYTYRHDYGLDRTTRDFISSGMTNDERRHLWAVMAQMFDNNIAPELEDYRRLQTGEAVVVPKDREHAEALVRVGMFYLENSK